MLNKMAFTSFMRKYRIEEGNKIRDNLKEAQNLGIDTLEFENKLNTCMAAFSKLENLGKTIDRHKVINEPVDVDKVYELLFCLHDIIQFFVWLNEGTSECLKEVIETKDNVIELQKDSINILENTITINDDIINRLLKITQSH